jgi:hypothetical protein
LLPEHSLLNYPNKITQKDFDGWIQERGLYFAQDWDKKNYQALFSSNDKEEGKKEGSVLYAQYGKGHYIYTGLVVFPRAPSRGNWGVSLVCEYDFGWEEIGFTPAILDPPLF